ncbi:hypothetical protein AGIG_G22011 [Arapaima gigas]
MDFLVDLYGQLTMYQTPRMMVPVRTWQQKQQLVETQRSHREIIVHVRAARRTQAAVMSDPPHRVVPGAGARVRAQSPRRRDATASARRASGETRHHVTRAGF